MSVSTKSVNPGSISPRQLLDDLEQRWALTQAELTRLRAENAELKQQLAQFHASTSDAAEVDVPEDVTESVTQNKAESVPTSSPPVDVSASEESNPEPPAPHALLTQWYQRYPKAFFKGHTQPLKVGIHQDLAEREPWSGKLIRRALANYVNLPRYIKSVREGAVRIDLDGNEAGVVDSEAARHAAEKRAQQASASPNERPQAPKGANPHAKTPKPTKKAPTNPQKKAEKTPSGADAPQKQLSLEDKLLGLQKKFQSR
ncbi:ProQ/FINO family protein [Halomonas sp. hl-4]|uniref:ProQ/FINO family protein n=1 Tax=Halomonas sp. hl-4 TaxID=1761789 RepID=UPI000BB6BFFC|nr:ProQ/FINO family protein [Halomonas sp. hl-4]SNY96605.1 ProP effector [Halomonas sp. hl-4]